MHSIPQQQMVPRVTVWLSIAICLALPGRVLEAQTEPHSQSTAKVSFSREIAPILATHCVACHGAKAAESDYQLHTFSRLMRSGSSGEPPIVAEKPDASYLMELLVTEEADLRMPKESKPLAGKEIDLIRHWIADGAVFDGEDAEAAIETYLPTVQHPTPPVEYPRPVPVTALAFSPDGSVLASSGYHEILLWDRLQREPRLVRRLANVPQRTHAIAFSYDGSLVAIAGGTPGRLGEVRLLDPQTGETIAVLWTASDEVFDVEFSRDGSRVAACGADRSIRVFDVASRSEVRRVEAHADWVMAVAWSPDGAKLASASRDKTAKIIDAETGAVEVTYPGHDEQVFDVVFAGDGQQVYSAGRGRELHRWSVDGKTTSKSDVRKKETGPIFGRTKGDIHRLLLDGEQVLALSTDGKLSVFDPNAKEGSQAAMVYEGAPPQAFSAAMDKKNHRVAVGSFDGRVAIYQIEDAAPWRVFVAAPGFG